jgi:hypothetical protein
MPPIAKQVPGKPTERMGLGHSEIYLAAATPGWQLKCTGWAWWIVMPLVIAGVWLLVRMYRQEMRTVRPGLGNWLLLLRTTVLALMLVFLLEPTLTRRASERVLPLVAVVVDQSGSMAVRDELMAPGSKLAEAIGLDLLPASVRPNQANVTDQAASDRAVVEGAKDGTAVAKGLARLAAMTRYERAIKLAQGKVVPMLRDKARVKVFSLDTGLAPLDLAKPNVLLPNRATDFETCLAKLARDSAQDYLGGVVLLTDGRQTAGMDPTPVLRSMRARGTQVAGILVGDPGEPADAVVGEVSGPSEVFVGENVSMTVRYRITGEEDLAWDLVMTHGGSVLERRRAQGSGRWEYEHFAFAATNAGMSGYQARLELAGGQTAKEASLANNTAEFSVVVNEDPIRVLLVDSTPRWESRYLAAMFERDRRLNFTRRYNSILSEDKGQALLPKTQAEWDGYDMVCLGDLDSNELPPEQQKCLANFVARRGGFLVCLAGPRGLPKAFSLGALANLLPVRVALSSIREPEPVRVALTSEGVDHPIMQVLNDSAHNQKLWPLLPPLEWIADTVVAKPGASVLLAAQNPARTPIVAAQRYGAGRVFWVGTEETWRWRDRLGERVHQAFWLQAMRWGLAGRLRGKDPRLQVGLDRYLMTTSEAAELKARVTGLKGEPIADPPLVRVERLGDDGEPITKEAKNLEMLPLADAPGLWQQTVSGLAEGSWRITTTRRDNGLKGRTEIRELVVRSQDGVEGLELGGDFAGLTRLTTAGGHLAGTMDQAGRILLDFASHLKPRVQEHPETIRLWDSYLTLAVIAVPLCVEWVLRKRHGLP